MARTNKLAEGKTKIIWQAGGDDGDKFVLIESKDTITAGDGARRDVIENKSVLATTTTVNCFKLLRSHGIPTHFSRQEDERTFLAQSVHMIPLELVVRRIATGSYLKRYTAVVEGTILPYVVEFFAKDDAQHDPLVIHDFAGLRVLYYDPKNPFAQGFLSEQMMSDAMDFHEAIPQLRALALRTFQTIELAWAQIDVTLVDLKIECGWGLGGHIVVADVIDNDSWRIWPGGKKAEMKDKEVYRLLQNATAEELGKIKQNYTWVAEQTAKFLA